MDERLQTILKAHWLFASLETNQIKQIVERASVKQYTTDHTLFFQGDPADRFYIILEGSVSIEVISTEGRSLTLATFSEGDIFGEFAILDGGLRSANARVISDARMVSFHQSTIHNLISRYPTFVTKLISELVKRLRVSNEHVQSVVIKSLKERLVALLISLSESTETSATGIICITQNQIAERLSVSREKVNVNLRSLQKQKLISLKRGRIEILNLALLRSLSDFG